MLLISVFSNPAQSDEPQWSTKIFVFGPASDHGGPGHIFQIIFTARPHVIENFERLGNNSFIYAAAREFSNGSQTMNSEYLTITPDRTRAWIFPLQDRPERPLYVDVVSWGPGDRNTRFGGNAFYGEFSSDSNNKFLVYELDAIPHTSPTFPKYQLNIEPYSVCLNNCAQEGGKLINQVFGETIIRPLDILPNTIMSRLKESGKVRLEEELHLGDWFRHVITSASQEVKDTVSPVTTDFCIGRN